MAQAKTTDILCLLILALCNRSLPTTATPSGSSTGSNARPVTIWKGISGGYEFSWTTTSLGYVARGKTNQVSLTAWLDGGDVTLDPGCALKTTVKLLSIVGTTVSLQRSLSRHCRNHENHVENTAWYTVDARSGRLVGLTDLFSSDTVHRALLREPIIGSALHRTGIGQTPRYLKSLVSRLSRFVVVFESENLECRASLERILRGFSFHRIQKGKVMVRLRGDLEGDELCHVNPLEMEVELPIPKSISHFIRAAQKRTEGFMMERAEEISGGKSTTWTKEIGCSHGSREQCQASESPGKLDESAPQ